MRIKKVEKNDVDYPKSNEMSKNEVKKKVPKKLLVLGALGIGTIAVVCGVAYHKAKPVEVPLAGIMTFTDDVILLEPSEQNSGDLNGEEAVE